jgi:hypothetical protein
MKLKLFFAACLSGFAVCAQTIAPVQFATGFSNITEIAHAGSSRMYVVQQGGLIRMLESDGTVGATPFIDLSSTFGTCLPPRVHSEWVFFCVL